MVSGVEVTSFGLLVIFVCALKGRVSTDIGNMELWARG